MTDVKGGSEGPATDVHNEPVIDPTKNVLQLVEAAIRRQDDLRKLEARGLRREAEMRAKYEDRLSQAESARIDAIRRVDVEAVQQASAVAETRATALATQVAASAEAMRNQVAAAATAAATSLAAALVPLQEAIADLRRAQYEQQGQKAQVTETRSKGANNGLWIGIAIAGVFGLLSFVTTVAAIGIAIYFGTQ